MPRKRRIPLTTGRPQIPIDWNKVDGWLRGHMTAEGIADLLGMHRDTFYDRVLQEKGMPFTLYALGKKQAGKSMLQHRQFTSAMNGNSTMLKLLGEEWLGQGKKEDVAISDEKEEQFSTAMGWLEKKQQEEKPPEEKKEDTN